MKKIPLNSESAIGKAFELTKIALESEALVLPTDTVKSANAIADFYETLLERFTSEK